MFRLCLETMESGRIPIGVMHRPKERSVEGLERKLLGERAGPAHADIRLESQRPAYEKLLAGLT